MDRNEEGWRGTKRYGEGLGGVEWDGEGWREWRRIEMNEDGWRWMEMNGGFSVLIEPFLVTNGLFLPYKAMTVVRNLRKLTIV